MRKYGNYKKKVKSYYFEYYTNQSYIITTLHRESWDRSVSTSSCIIKSRYFHWGNGLQ